MSFLRLTEPGTAKPPKSAQFGQFWRFGRALLGQPSKVHEATNFLGMNCCSTCKKVSKNPHFISMYFYAFNISLFEMGVKLDMKVFVKYLVVHHLYLIE